MGSRSELRSGPNGTPADEHLHWHGHEVFKGEAGTSRDSHDLQLQGTIGRCIVIDAGINIRRRRHLKRLQHRHLDMEVSSVTDSMHRLGLGAAGGRVIISCERPGDRNGTS